MNNDDITDIIQRLSDNNFRPNGIGFSAADGHGMQCHGCAGCFEDRRVTLENISSDLDLEYELTDEIYNKLNDLMNPPVWEDMNEDEYKIFMCKRADEKTVRSLVDEAKKNNDVASKNLQQVMIQFKADQEELKTLREIVKKQTRLILLKTDRLRTGIQLQQFEQESKLSLERYSSSNPRYLTVKQSEDKNKTNIISRDIIKIKNAER